MIRTRRIFRVYALILTTWSLVLGAFVVIFPRQIIAWLDIGTMDITFFVAFCGVFILLLAYIHWTYFNDIYNKKVFKILISFRFVIPIFFIIEALFVLPGSFKLLHYLLLGLAAASLAINILLVYLERKGVSKATMVSIPDIDEMPEKSKETSLVACVKDDDKFEALRKVIERTHFLENLEEAFSKSQKSKEDFLIAIKPNISLFVSKDNYAMITDPELVESLVNMIVDKGFKNVKVVESQMSLSLFLENRDVKTIAKYAGYSEKNYKIVDMTLEKIPYKFSGVLGDHFVGKTWHDADYRISFAKNKTHPWCYFTLTLKNIFGCCPEFNKIEEYHKKREWDTSSLDMLRAFPVHFGFIDAFYSADGQLGLSGGAKGPKYTGTIIGGKNLIAVDWFSGLKMGLNPMNHSLMRLAVEEWGAPNYEVYGNTEPYENWENIAPLGNMALDLIEESETAFGFIMHMLGPKNDPIFKDKNPLAAKIRRAFKLYFPE